MSFETLAPDLAAQNGTPWHSLTAAEILSQLRTWETEGLSAAEAEQRLAQFGPNQLIEAPGTTFWQMLWAQFNNFVVILLVVAALISALLGDYIEASAILAIVVLNAALGVVQERNAEQALAALRKLAAPEAQVIRGGSRQTVAAHLLVPGDIVLLEAGNYVPADLRLLEAVNLRLEEAALTGESLPVQKDAGLRLQPDIPVGDRKNTAFMGTLVNYGRGRGVVVSTGMHTQIGLIAEMLQAVEQEPTVLQRRLDELGKTLGIASLAVCALVFVVGWLRGFDPMDMFITAVSLAIAAVPEGLAAVVTISLALGMREMIQRHALIRRLSSVETLGSATIICSDKTGTLTQNAMTVTRVWAGGETVAVSGSGAAPLGDFRLDGFLAEPAAHPALQATLWLAALNNDAELEASGSGDSDTSYRMIGDPTEAAMIVAAAKAGARQADLNVIYPRVAEIPFDSIRKRMLTVHKLAGVAEAAAVPPPLTTPATGFLVTVKGAPDIVLDECDHFLQADGSVCPLDEAARMRLLAANDRMTQDALRVLGLAYRVTPSAPDLADPVAVERGLIFAGLVGMIDPARPEVPAALAHARRAGIRTVMITGDFPNTARAIAAEIGLLQPNHQVLTGPELSEMTDTELRQQVAYTDVFARVSPEHKLRIVEALRASGEIVAMTGDGVNDAPSIKRADIGVAMGITGTDVAKESADMVLTDDNYASIVAAVEQGRVIYSNIRKFVFYLLSCNLAEIAIIFLGILFTRGAPLTAIQLLWLNLISDGAPALALGTEKGDPDIMSYPPRPPSEPIINRFMQIGIGVQTVAITAVTLTAYVIGLRAFPTQPAAAETMAFVTLSFSELLRAYTARSERIPLHKIGIFSNRNMNLGVLVSLLLLLGVVYIPFLNPIFSTVALGWAQWQVMLPLLLIPSLAAEATKVIAGRRVS